MIDISNLPTGWAIESLNELCILNPKHHKGLSDDLDVSFVPMAAVDEKSGTISSDVELRKLGKVRKGYTHFANGDVIFAKITPCMENGKSAVAKNLCNGLACGSTEFYTLRSYGAISPEYLHPFLRQNSYIQYASMNMTGVVGQRRVPKDFILSCQIPLPPLNEQKRIVAKIEALQTRSTAVKQELEQIKPLLDQFRQSVLAAAFRGDLTKDWREQNPDVEPAEVLLERIRVERRHRWEEAELEKMKANGKVPKDDSWKKKYKEPEAIDTEDLPELPDDWCWTHLDNICEKITDGEHITPPTTDSGVYLLSAKDVRDGHLDFSDTKFVDEEFAQKSRNRCNPERNDILVVSRGATVGRTCRINTDDCFCLMGSVLLFKVYKQTIDSAIIELFFKSPFGIKKLSSMSGASAQQAIYIRDMRSFTIAIPPLEE